MEKVIIYVNNIIKQSRVGLKQNIPKYHRV